MGKIPIIDLNEITSPGTLNTKVASEIRDALHEIGFMYLKNHNVPEKMVSDAFSVSSKFFSLDLETKEKYRKIPVETNHGWIKAGQELLNENSVFELREGFDFVSGDGRPIIECPQFCETMDKFKLECQTFMKKLLPLLSQSLEMDDIQYFTNCCGHLEDNSSVPNECDLRVIYYPPVPQEKEIPKGTIRCSEHTDYELCTLLFQDDVGGLEVKTSDGKWIPATPVPGTILVNTGDLLERWTCGYYKATKHRVIIPDKEIDKRIPRYSFAYFFAPDNSTIISPLTEKSKILKAYETSGERGKDFDTSPITAYDHIMAKVKEAYKY